MKNTYIMTIDYGTQSVRTAIVNAIGEIVAIQKETYKEIYFSKKPGYAEQNPDVYFDTMALASRKMFEANPQYKNQIVGVALTCFRDSHVMCDENMNPVRPAILWLDQRQAKGKEKIPFYSHILFGLVGMTNTLKLNKRRTPAHWVKENEPEIWAKVKKYMNVSTYINYKLTGEYKDSVANYAGHFPTNFKKRSFYKSDRHFQGAIFGIKLKTLCELVPIGGVIGQISKEASIATGIPEGTKLFSIGSDKSCETLGLGCLTNDVAALSCGTASSIEVQSKKFHNPEPFLPAYPSVLKGYYNMDVQVYRGYWMLSWFSKQFAQKEIAIANEQNVSVEKILNEHLDEVPPGCNGLILQPYWGPGLSRPLSRGAIIGFSDTITKMHLYRAIIEGIDYELRRGLESIEKNQHKKVNRIMISGGGSQSDQICQIASDIFNLPVSRVQTFETSTLGAAIAGFIAAGVYKDGIRAVENMVRITRTFLPNSLNREVYDFMYKKGYKKMYPSLKNIYKDIKNFENRKSAFERIKNALRKNKNI